MALPAEPAEKLTERGARSQHRAVNDESSIAWLLPFGLLVLSIVAVPLLILGDDGLPKYRALKEEVAELDVENERLRAEVQALARETRALTSDVATLERIARDELGMVRKGEIVLQF